MFSRRVSATCCCFEEAVSLSSPEEEEEEEVDYYSLPLQRERSFAVAGLSSSRTKPSERTPTPPLVAWQSIPKQPWSRSGKNTLAKFDWIVADWHPCIDFLPPVGTESKAKLEAHRANPKLPDVVPV